LIIQFFGGSLNLSIKAMLLAFCVYMRNHAIIDRTLLITIKNDALVRCG